MPETLEEMVTDFEKSAMLFSKLYSEMRKIRQKLTQDQLEVDMYADDPAGVTGIIGSATGQTGGNLSRQYNGPYVVESILATWIVAGVTSVTLKMGDRTFQLLPSSGFFNPQAMKLKMARDDQIIMTVTPAAACHLELFGYAEKRRTDRT